LPSRVETKAINPLAEDGSLSGVAALGVGEAGAVVIAGVSVIAGKGEGGGSREGTALVGVGVADVGAGGMVVAVGLVFPQAASRNRMVNMTTVLLAEAGILVYSCLRPW
jgi:hypothetical protein